MLISFNSHDKILYFNNNYSNFNLNLKVKLNNKLILSIYIHMAQRSESDYRLLPSFLITTCSVLNQRNRNLKWFGNAIVFAHHPTNWNFYFGK